MEVEALDRPAALKVWHAVAERFLPAEPERFASLREAIAAAAAALVEPERQPWIVTEDGDLMSPNWIRSRLN
ncbi:MULTISPECIES: hypothetical protein [Methylobacterium]|uniref:hypothetical protein n=1 Tax=Methylobacterium TaxID=407 RepID=UPI0010462106|nr:MULTISPECIES: hypothetical protein [Methylobacterium]MDR7035705.1 hypothetical protein [Methylobacterium sp. BE186]